MVYRKINVWHVLLTYSPPNFLKHFSARVNVRDDGLGDCRRNNRRRDDPSAAFPLSGVLSSVYTTSTMAARTSLQGTVMNTPSLATLADPPARMMDGPVMDYFLIELVNTVRASSAVAVARTKKVEQEMIEAGLLPAQPPNTNALSNRDSLASNLSKPDGKTLLEEEEEAVRLRLESIGTHVGANIAER